MGAFFVKHITWITPLIAIALTMVIKISSKPEYIPLNRRDFLDFGFDLSMSSIILVVSHIVNMSDVAAVFTGIWIMVLSFVFIMIISIFVNRKGWNKEKEEPTLLGIILPDLLGIVLLVIATLYVGGLIV